MELKLKLRLRLDLESAILLLRRAIQSRPQQTCVRRRLAPHLRPTLERRPAPPAGQGIAAPRLDLWQRPAIQRAACSLEKPRIPPTTPAPSDAPANREQLPAPAPEQTKAATSSAAVYGCLSNPYSDSCAPPTLARMQIYISSSGTSTACLDGCGKQSRSARISSSSRAPTCDTRVRYPPRRPRGNSCHNRSSPEIVDAGS